jgi:hypothetical protein
VTNPIPEVNPHADTPHMDLLDLWEASEADPVLELAFHLSCERRFDETHDPCLSLGRLTPIGTPGEEWAKARSEATA